MAEILLSTYNGARYLEAFLDSLVAQTHTGWFLSVRDDGSSDDTLEVLRRHVKKHGYDARIQSTAGARLGYPATYYSLISTASEEHVFFADQDDIWLPDKLSTLSALLQESASNRPTLVHSDLVVVDERNRIIAPSYLELDRGKPPRSNSLLGLLLCNYVTGAASAANLSLLRRVRAPSSPVPHDWWCALTAAAFGEVRFIDRATVRYRQHESNAIGAFSARERLGPGAGAIGRLANHLGWLGQAAYDLSWIGLSAAEGRRRNRAYATIAEQFLSVYGDTLSSECTALLHWYIGLDSADFFEILGSRFRSALPSNRKLARRILRRFLLIQARAVVIEALDGFRRTH